MIKSSANGIWGDDPTGDTSDVACVRAADFDRRSHRVKTEKLPRRSIDPQTLRQHILKPGDLVLEKSGGGDKQPVGAAVLFDLDEPAVCTNFCARITPAQGIDPRYLSYVFAAAYNQGLTQSAIKQTTGIQNLDSGAFFSSPWAYPRTDEQRRIADFLDAETTRIDRLSGHYLRLSQVIEEHEKSHLDLMFNETGNITPLRYLVRYREGPGIMATDFRDSGIPLVRLSGLQDGQVTLKGCNYLNPSKVASKWSQFRLREGDYVISGSATMGAVSIVDDKSVAGAIPYTGLIILRPAIREIDMEYVSAFLRSTAFASQIDLLKAGATMQHFGPTHLSQIKMPLPSLPQQRAISAKTRAARSQAMAIVSTTKRQIDLLAERRQALITAAVTGQLDVTTARSGVR
ncbi:restriction endonuclease subunit S [Saccharothrix deserti]|uniref:restriction endonuclease subunit S n=1 Tax=Saccharothrix deserti TaxID=2593674 RepID=UPI00131A77FB|nr:restriction endonuclease subunit S [Saccharothrix deserti]